MVGETGLELKIRQPFLQVLPHLKLFIFRF
jgi:hypothetical protein